MLIEDSYFTGIYYVLLLEKEDYFTNNKVKIFDFFLGKLDYKSHFSF